MDMNPGVRILQFKMDDCPTNCVAGWPKTNIGYPYCDTERGAEEAFHVPDLYTYCCPPIPCELSDISGVALRHVYRYNVPKPRGVHSYYNMMWDGHIRRGDPAQRIARKEEEECDKIRQRLSAPRQSKSLAERLAERKAKALAAMASTPEEALNREIARYTKLELSKLVPTDPTKYLIDLSDEIDIIEPCYKGKRLPPLREFPIAPSRAINLEDRATQLYEDEFFDFDGQAEPILARIVACAVDQAHLELLQEEELKTLLDQQARHLQRMQDARDAIVRWQLREQSRRDELERQLAERRRREEGDEMMYYNICAFSNSLTKDAINDCIEALTRDGYLMSRMKAMLTQVFIPWLNDRVDKEVRGHKMLRTMLDVVIQDVVDIREVQYSESIWNPGYQEDEEEEPFQENGGREGTSVPPPTPGSSIFGESDGEEEEARTSQNLSEA